MQEAVKRWRARAIAGGKDATQLVLARRIGESFTVELNGETVEVTVCSVHTNTVALLIETAEKNLVLRKELLADGVAAITEQ